MLTADILSKIRVIAMDVDGVLTDGRIIFDAGGHELKFFDVKDGYAVAQARKAGFTTAVISARGCPAVRARMADLKIDKVYLNASPKLEAYEDLLRSTGAADDEVCYIGDDVPDLDILRRVGFSAAPCDAALEVKSAVRYVALARGGRGAVREVIETILKDRGQWII